MGNCDDMYGLFHYEIDKRVGKRRKDIASGSSDIPRPALRCLSDNVHSVIQLAQKCCFGGLASFAIPTARRFNFVAGGVEEMKLIHRSFR